MALNSIATASKYTAELDKMYVQKAVTGFLADNVFGAKFVGAKTVVMPDIDFVGLTKYDRDNGFAKAKTTIGQTSYVLSQDRGRSLQLDRMDMDETGVASLAGKVLSEYCKTKVVPECDAYVISKLWAVANDEGNVSTYVAADAYKNLVNAINKVQSNAGYDTELVAFVNPELWAALMTSNEISRMITVSDFKQGEINLKVKQLNDVTLIPVSESRMKTEFDFVEDDSDATVGGFSPKADAKDIYALVLPKNGAHLVKKTEQLRIFTPEQNLDADAYKFDYRIFYDVFVKKSGLKNIFAITGE